jgi:hypothetical protein
VTSVELVPGVISGMACSLAVNFANAKAIITGQLQRRHPATYRDQRNKPYSHKLNL